MKRFASSGRPSASAMTSPGPLQGRFSPSPISPAPLGNSDRAPIGGWVRPGRPVRSRFAPSHSGFTSAMPRFSAIRAQSSADTMLICRRLAISVPLAYQFCRLSAGRVRP
ncbi:hypothetical protein LJK88_02710 [Paenibacillus sp. P26]|nr:hypothetical protein LJK88_02710 [Paenibacillus sp. P26]